MADQKLTELTPFTPILTDELYGVDDPGGVPVSGDITLTSLLTLLDASTSTFTGKTFDLDANTLTGSLAEFNTALQSDTFFTLAGGVTVAGDNVFSGISSSGESELTIAAAVVTVTRNFHRIDTESNDPTDDLDTINGGVDGAELVIRTVNNGRDVTVRHEIGNISLSNAVNYPMTDTRTTLSLVWSSTRSLWLETSRSTGVSGTADTLSFDLDANTLTGTLAEFNTALQSDSFFPLSGGVTVTGDVTINAIKSCIPTELTVSSGVITVTRNFHHVDTESDGATDELDTINGGTAAREGMFLVLRSETDARDVTVRDESVNSGNIALTGNSSFTLSSRRDTLTLMWSNNHARWLEISRSSNNIGEVFDNKTFDLDANTLTGTLAEFNTALQSDSFMPVSGGAFTGLVDFQGDVRFSKTELTIVSGAVTKTKSWHLIAGESGAADDLDTINGGVTGDFLIITSSTSANDITVTEAGNIKLESAGNFILTNTNDTMMLLHWAGAWLELSRSDNTT